jgi:hypothetical protein
MPVRGSSAMAAVIKTLGALASDAKAHLDEIKQLQTELETETYKTWDPLKIDALPVNMPSQALPTPSTSAGSTAAAKPKSN